MRFCAGSVSDRFCTRVTILLQILIWISALIVTLPSMALPETAGSSVPGGSAARSSLAAADDQDQSSEQGHLEEILVTAQRRKEKLQDIPISAQVIGGQTLTDRDVNSLNDLSETVPSVHIGQNGRSDSLFIRGIGSDENQSFDQSVGTFIDDIYHGRSRTSAATFLDLDRIEILKGPQSTFFGNNAIAGAFNIVTRKPGDQFEGSARALYGEAGQYVLEGAAGGPISDKIYVRAAATFNGMSGWMENVNLHRDVPKVDDMAGRITLLFKPSDDLNATFKIEGSRNRTTGPVPLQVANCPPAAPFTPAGFCNLVIAQGLPTGLDNNKNADSAGQGIKLNTAEEVLTVNYQHWGHTFTSVSGYYNYDFNFNFDADGTPLSLANVQLPERYNQFSQEFRVASAADQPLSYLGGVYFQTDHVAVQQALAFQFLTPTLTAIPPFAPLVPYLPLGQETDFSQREHTYSVFGAVSWNATDRLKVSGGLRGSRVEKDFNWDLFYATATQDYGGLVRLPAAVAPLPGALGLGNAGTLSLNRSDSAWMPSAQIQYKINPRAMVYFSYAKGFKAGGFNGNDNTAVAANLPFAPEHVNAYELGLKSEWFDDRLLLNLDVFRSDYGDLQVAVNQYDPGGTFVALVRNAAASRSEGVEFEGKWAIDRHFRLAADVTYLHAYYLNYPNAGSTDLQQLNGIQTQDLSGRPTEYAPRWSGSFAGTYSTPVVGDYQLTMELSTYFSSAYFLTDIDETLQGQGAYSKINGRLSLATSDGRWAVDLIGNNLTDRTILVFASNIVTALGSTRLGKEQPRNLAVQFRYRW
jgi:iron complex outermembrane receptor protein